jgi:hypothetical protein
LLLLLLLLLLCAECMFKVCCKLCGCAYLSVISSSFLFFVAGGLCGKLLSRVHLLCVVVVG